MRNKTLTSWMIAVGIALLGVGLIGQGAAVGEGIRRGLSICGEVLIPALFPFMALCCWLGHTDAARLLSMPLSPLTRHVFRLREDLGTTVLLSLIGGYPVGAKMISSHLAQKRISPQTAERMLSFCYGGSPSFLISAVGVGMLGSRKLGGMLYLAQVLGALLVGALTARKAPKVPRAPLPPKQGEGIPGFVTAIQEASAAMLGMCAWAVLFSGLLALFSASGLTLGISRLLPVGEPLLKALLAGLFEVTSGCLFAARLGGDSALLLLCLFCSFGGLSVVFQAVSCFGEEIRFAPFLRGRLLHGGISTGLFLLMVRLWGNDALAVMLPSANLIPQTAQRPWLAWGCILAMCTMLLLRPRARAL